MAAALFGTLSCVQHQEKKLSTSPTIDLAAEAMANAVKAYLQKPIRMQTLYNIIPQNTNEKK
jgi:DNA-binding NtrC family response regulator